MASRGGGRGAGAGGGYPAAAPRWGRGGGKGGRTPWSFFHAVDAKDSLGLVALSKSIPDEWIDWRHGGRRAPERMHSTVILKMTEPEHLQRLRRLAAEAAPLRVEVRELFCERVERIKDAEVFCIGVALGSPALRRLKDAWVSESPEAQRKAHVPYDSEGHISLAYIKAESQEKAQDFVAENAVKAMDNAGLLVDHIAYEDEQGRELPVPLGAGGGGSAASSAPERPSKGARKGPGPHDGPVLIDGSVLEGGGQILRMSSSYSALFGTPINIAKIRAGRSKPGLAPQHLESLRLVRDVSGGALTNDRVGSCEVSLTPATLLPGSFSADPGTAGAITLMIQASLVPLLFTGGACSCELRGGTDVSFSPPLDFLRRVLMPTLARMGASFTLDVLLRGFFPRGGGRVRLTVPPLAEPLRAIDMSDRGAPARAHAVLYSTQPIGALQGACVQAVRSALAGLAPALDVEVAQAPATGDVWKYWLDVVVETSTGCLFHGGSEPKDLPWPGKAKGRGGGHLPDMFSTAAAQAKAHIGEQLASGAAVEVHLADQLILPATLAAGTSRLLVAELSMHSRTAIHIAELLVPGVQFRQTPRGALTLLEIDGIAHEPPPPRAAEAAAAAAPASAAPPAAAPASAAPGPRHVAPRPVAPRPVAPRPVAPRPAAPRPALAADEEAVQLRAGALSRADGEMLRTFGDDMAHISRELGVAVRIEAAADVLVLRGGAAERRSAAAELCRADGVLAYYSIARA